MYKCMETGIIESIRSIRIDLSAPDVCHVTCGLLEKWCFLMVDWARQSLYFKDIKVILDLFYIRYHYYTLLRHFLSFIIGFYINLCLFLLTITKIDDQIKLLKNSWIDILLLDLMWKQCRSNELSGDTIVCVNDQAIKIGGIKHAQLGDICKAFMRCVAHFKSVNWHYAEYLALKYLVLFDPGLYTSTTLSIF